MRWRRSRRGRSPFARRLQWKTWCWVSCASAFRSSLRTLSREDYMRGWLRIPRSGASASPVVVAVVCALEARFRGRRAEERIAGRVVVGDGKLLGLVEGALVGNAAAGEDAFPTRGTGAFEGGPAGGLLRLHLGLGGRADV